MSLESIAKYLEKHHLTTELIERTNRVERLILTGASRTAKALITTSLAKNESKRLLVIVPTLEDATRWYPLVKTAVGLRHVYIQQVKYHHMKRRRLLQK